MGIFLIFNPKTAVVIIIFEIIIINK